MATSVTLPALGESVTEGTVTRWLKQPGDRIEVDEPLLEVSTDKVDTEIPSPVAGTLQEILVQEDDTVPVGADLAVIGDGAAPSGGDSGPSDAVSDQSDGDAVAQAGDEGGQEPAEPQAEAQPEPQQAEPQQAAPQQAAPQQPAEQPAPAASGDGTTVTMPALGESVTEGTVT